MALKMRYLELNRKIRDVRMLAIQGIAEAGSGHPGASFSAAEIMGVLYFHKMKNRPTDPFWEERVVLAYKDILLDIRSDKKIIASPA